MILQQKKINSSGIIQLLPVLFLAVAVGLGVYLVKNPTFFSPRAGDERLTIGSDEGLPSSSEISQKGEPTGESEKPKIEEKKEEGKNEGIVSTITTTIQKAIGGSDKPVATKGPTAQIPVYVYTRVYSDDSRNTPGSYFLESTLSTISSGQQFVFNTDLSYSTGDPSMTLSLNVILPSQLDFIDGDDECVLQSNYVTCSVSLAQGQTKSAPIRFKRKTGVVGDGTFNLKSDVLGVSQSNTYFGTATSHVNNYATAQCNAVVVYRDDPANTPGNYRIDSTHRVNLGETIVPGSKYIVALWPQPLYGQAANGESYYINTYLSGSSSSVAQLPIDYSSGCQMQGINLVCGGFSSLVIKAARYVAPGTSGAILDSYGSIWQSGSRVSGCQRRFYTN